MHELTPVSTNLEMFSHNIFLKYCSQYFPSAISQDLSKGSVEIILLHQTAVLALIYCVLMDQTNQSFLVIPYKIGVWHSEPKMKFLSLYILEDLPLRSRRSSCIRTLLRK